jgi:hypothetical protein
MSRSEESRNREQRKPILHIAPSRHRPAFSPIAEEHENARPFLAANSLSVHTLAASPKCPSEVLLGQFDDAILWNRDRSSGDRIVC